MEKRHKGGPVLFGKSTYHCVICGASELSEDAARDHKNYGECIVYLKHQLQDMGEYVKELRERVSKIEAKKPKPKT